jgi:TRAP-type uncharacterized transport system fused permease subunit
LTGLGFKLSYELGNLAGASIIILLFITAVASTIMGMGLPVISCYILLVILVAPALGKMGITPLAAHLFVFYFGVLSFITPPVAPAAYVAASIARSNFMSVGWKAMQLGIVAYIVPFFFILHPSLLMMGSPAEIISAFTTATVGVLFLAIGIEGYLLRPLGWLARCLFVIGGIGLVIPGWQTDLLGILPILKEWKSFRDIVLGRLRGSTILSRKV